MENKETEVKLGELRKRTWVGCVVCGDRVWTYAMQRGLRVRTCSSRNCKATLYRREHPEEIRRYQREYQRKRRYLASSDRLVKGT
jgi:hypothetical protein